MILSNTDRHIMEHTLRQLTPLTFDAVVVAEDVRAYKPDTRNFTKALQACGARPEEILHVAFGFKYDIGPAQEVGMSTAWINRHREDAAGRRAAGLTSGATCGGWPSSLRGRRGPARRRRARAPPRARAQRWRPRS